MADDRSDLKSQMTDAVNKILLTGVGTIFMTQEAVKGLLGELKLPKEMLGSLLDNAAKQKQEFFQILAKEATTMFSRIDLSTELKKVIDGHKVKINIEVSLDPKADRKKASKAK